jgi:hypothetical protein
MVKKKYNDDLFVYLNWILKKPIQEPQLQNTPTTYITNRWLSMVDREIANVVNITFNKWLTCKIFSSDNSLAGKFYRIVLPKNTKRISYLKKTIINKTSEPEDTEALAKNLEMSQKEILMYKETLDFLSKNNN